MSKKIVYIFLVLMIGAVYASDIEPTIPLKISDVKTRLINKKNLVRIIEFNTEYEPKIVIERLARPGVKVLEKLVIDKVELGNKIVDFSNSAATSFESIDVVDNDIKINVYYAYPGKGGGSVDFECIVKVSDSNFSKPKCTEIKQ